MPSPLPPAAPPAAGRPDPAADLSPDRSADLPADLSPDLPADLPDLSAHRPADLSAELLAAPAAPPVPGPGPAYWRFYEQVARAQVTEWLPVAPSRVLDLSGAGFAAQLVQAGHEVVHVCERPVAVPVPGTTSGRLLPVVADPRRLPWLADEAVDAVLAEARALSRCLAAEVTAGDLVRVLRPGGRVLVVVDSLTAGLARLAGQGRWAELADVPAADLVLVPGGDGTISRCFLPEELSTLLQGAGLEVEWVRPRSVLAPAAVERALTRGGRAAMSALVASELALARERSGAAGELHLVASARRPDGGTACCTS